MKDLERSVKLCGRAVADNENEAGNRRIQITAAISPGSSGSPVVDLSGKVVGVATLQFARGQNINFAVPSEQITRLRTRPLMTFAELNREVQRDRRTTAEKSYREGLARRFTSENACEKAIAYFEKAVEYDPSYADPWAQIGYCEWISTNHLEGEAIKSGLERAISAYKEAVRLRPDWAEPLYRLGIVYRDLAIWHHNRAIYHPDLARAERVQAVSNFEMSADLIRRAIDKASRPNGYGPDLGNMFASLADTLSDLERYKEAAEAYQRALEINPNDARTRFLLGKVFLQLGDRRSAMEQYSILRRIETGAMLTSYTEMLLEEIKK